MSRRIAYHSRLGAKNNIYDDMSPSIPGARKAYADRLFGSLEGKHRKTSSWDKIGSYPQQNDKLVSSSRRLVAGGVFSLLAIGGIAGGLGIRSNISKNRAIELEALRKEKELLKERKRQAELKFFSPKRDLDLEKGLRRIGIPEDKINNIINSAVSIVTSSGNGSGFFIGKDIIITAKHVITRPVLPGLFLTDKPEIITDIKGNIYMPLEVSSDDSDDIAIIKVAGESEGFIELEDGESESITRATIGFSEGKNKPSITTGTIIKKDGKKYFTNSDINRNGVTDAYEYDFLSNPTTYGDSGSPVVNKSGNLVGLIVQKWPSTGKISSISVSERISRIKEFIREENISL